MLIQPGRLLKYILIVRKVFQTNAFDISDDSTLINYQNHSSAVPRVCLNIIFSAYFAVRSEIREQGVSDPAQGLLPCLMAAYGIN